MKKNFLLLTLCAGMGWVVLQSTSGGAATGAGIRNGVKGNPNNCGGSTCHGGASTATTTGIRVDSVGGVQVNRYVAGMTYTVTVTGGHTSLTRFGFQFAAVSGTGSAQAQAGSFTTLPSQVAEHTSSSVKFVEQTSAITGPLSKTFKWTAPASGVGDIKMYLTVNAVNGASGADAADVSDDSVLTLTHYVPPSSSVGTVANAPVVSAFPNPIVGSDLHLNLAGSYTSYSVAVYDITGRNVYAGEVAASLSGASTINTSNWAPGLYKVTVASGDNTEVISVVKQ